MTKEARIKIERYQGKDIFFDPEWDNFYIESKDNPEGTTLCRKDIAELRKDIYDMTLIEVEPISAFFQDYIDIKPCEIVRIEPEGNVLLKRKIDNNRNILRASDVIINNESNKKKINEIRAIDNKISIWRKEMSNMINSLERFPEDHFIKIYNRRLKEK